MANTDNPTGLTPVGHLLGLPYSQNGETVYVSASYATAIFIGDAVDIDTALTDKKTDCKMMTVMRATAGDGNEIYGIVVGMEPIWGSLQYQYHPASTEGYLIVISDPFVIFRIQDNGSAVPTAVFVGQNANTIDTHSGSTVTGLSGTELSCATPAANDSYNLFIRNMSNIEDNELAINAKWDVLINCHRLKANSTSDGTAVGILGITST